MIEIPIVWSYHAINQIQIMVEKNNAKFRHIIRLKSQVPDKLEKKAFGPTTKKR